ncbi:hypothetical protein GCM10012320_34900 [Sinomonas cellulolyticus]|nr:hypothetical protein GCM10012320_34900 [Sinomonas sp. KCTC 49339]
MIQPDLATLLGNVKAKKEWSYEAMSRACGGAPSGKRLFQLITAPLKNFPDPETIQSLARGTGASITDIVMASARSLGLEVVDADPDSLHVPGLSDVPTSMREAIIAVGREASRLSGQAHHAQDSRRQDATDELELQRAARRRPRKGQKTDQPAHPPVADVDDELPENWQELAAYKGPTSHLERERYFDELGEAPQVEPDV